MNLPVILRPAADADIQATYDELEQLQVGLGNRFVGRVRVMLRRETGCAHCQQGLLAMTTGTCGSRPRHGPQRHLLFPLGHHAAEWRATVRALLEMNLDTLSQLLVELAGNVLVDVRLNVAATDVAVELRGVVRAAKLLHCETADQ